LLKKTLQIIGIFSVFIALFGFIGFFGWQKINSPRSSDKTLKSFVVAKGTSAKSVGIKLEKDGFIKSGFFFKLYLRLTNRAEKIVPGSYLLSPNSSMTEIVGVLLKGPKDVWVLVPEGLRREEVAQIFFEGLSKDENSRDQFLEEFMTESQGKEGFLFPDTYLLAKEITAAQIVKKMKQVFDSQTEEFSKEMINGKTSRGLTQKEVITLASIVERETKDDIDRPVVAGILLNRLKIGMPLQTDATVQYAVANAKCQTPNAKTQILNTKCKDWWPVLSLDDLKIDSNFNTYKYQGLPQSPIANPGIASIKAVFFPDNNDYLYYLHDKEGKIHTAKTFGEHARNVGKFLK
jgi:UPF0755 protein